MTPEKPKTRKPALSYNHNKDADSPSALALRSEIVKEINANVIKPVLIERNSNAAVKRAKSEYEAQNKNHPILMQERSQNVNTIVEAELSGKVKFNATIKVFK